MATNFHLAPPATLNSGMMCVPIDISHIEANMVFDLSNHTAKGDAFIKYLTGSVSGCPIFDLRQTITEIFEDDSLVATPLNKIFTADFGGGANAGMKVLKQTLPANSAHKLRLKYNIGIPDASTAGSYQPHVDFTGNRLVFNFGFTDLGAGRYLESFAPANLVYDQYSIEINVRLVNSTVSHSVITNGIVTSLGFNNWKISFPTTSTALSTLLEIRPADTLTCQSDTVLLPVSGQTVTITAWKPATSALDLATQLAAVKSRLIGNENNFGPYSHGNRFTVFLNTGGMEYDGATTTSPGSLSHEVFHSWWARGIKPSSQPDAWWDEAWTTYYDGGGGNLSFPFNFANAPVELCPRNPWIRITAPGSYDAGNTFWKGISALIGNIALRSLMKSFYVKYKSTLVSTTQIESYLLAKSGNATIVDAFHKFIYGIGDPVSTPDIWLKDDTTDVLGNNLLTGRFWNSPDIWVRNKDDDGLTHQSPEFGQDNWIYARVRNKSAVQVIKHFAVAFNVKHYAGTQFTYPDDFLPCLDVAVGFNLLPGSSQVVKIRWKKKYVLPANSHACIVVAALTRGDATVSGSHVWESNNLAQKNVTIVDVKPNGFVLIPFMVGYNLLIKATNFKLQLIRPPLFPKLEVSIIHNSKIFSNFSSLQPWTHFRPDTLPSSTGEVPHEHEPDFSVRTNHSDRIEIGFPNSSYEMHFAPEHISTLSFPLKKKDSLLLYLKIKLPSAIRHDGPLLFDLLQTTSDSKKIVGGISIEVNVVQ
ncbi:hypothetical protein [Dyadobacter psychrotolerans]|uniref:Peptidase M1 membrane alanine aminopeptidase domain-containing protein n=1 Tax=Dyadobacter psychrotolerans TaxID=2541721 RepID=A0A4R5E107_9BACT|nr:hypothetical protein [Dyadobacter psychrotolerans]TDE17343.1 hypothetical protein E0F88_05490 [Dyadobacter psychrotolerans]